MIYYTEELSDILYEEWLKSDEYGVKSGVKSYCKWLEDKKGVRVITKQIHQCIEFTNKNHELMFRLTYADYI